MYNRNLYNYRLLVTLTFKLLLITEPTGSFFSFSEPGTPGSLTTRPLSTSTSWKPQSLKDPPLRWEPSAVLTLVQVFSFLWNWLNEQHPILMGISLSPLSNLTNAAIVAAWLTINNLSPLGRRGKKSCRKVSTRTCTSSTVSPSREG